MTAKDNIKLVVTHDRQERQPITSVWQKQGLMGWRRISEDKKADLIRRLPAIG